MARTASAVLAALLGGCTQGGSPVATVVPAVRAPVPPAGAGRHIKHVMILVQENRSFVNLFRGFPGTDAPSSGLLGAKRIALRARPLEDPHNIDNNFPDAIESYDGGKMDGFWRETAYGEPRTFPYSYVPNVPDEGGPYWALARQWVVADRMFPTEFGASFAAHLNLIAANTELDPKRAEVDEPSLLPWTCEAPKSTFTYVLTSQRQETGNGPFPCFTQFLTIADRLDAAKRSWRYYAPPVSDLGGKAWTIFGAIQAVRFGKDWGNVVIPETRVFDDIETGRLADVSWVIPDLKNSDHAGSGSNTGPSWVAAVVNAIGRSKYWNSTAIVVVWDDWGGWYDDAPPPQLDFRGLGIRVPCLVISPYDRIAAGANAGYVSHTQYEFASTLKFVEEVFGLPRIGPPSLGYTDTRANSLLDVFDFTQKPRAFVPVPQPYTTDYLRARPHSFEPPDDD